MGTTTPRQPETTPRPWKSSRAYRIVLTIQLIACMAAGGWAVSSVVGPSHQAGVLGQAKLHLGKPGGTRTKNTRGCVYSEAWSYTYATPYLGEVYVNLTANPRTPVPANIVLIWGPWRWEHVIRIWPGMVQFGQGGTMLWYTKLYTTGRTGINPPIYLHASVPVCAYFGTTLDGMPTPATAVNANPGWYHWGI